MKFSGRLVFVTAAALLTSSTPLAAKKQEFPEALHEPRQEAASVHARSQADS